MGRPSALQPVSTGAGENRRDEYLIMKKSDMMGGGVEAQAHKERRLTRLHIAKHIAGVLKDLVPGANATECKQALERQGWNQAEIDRRDGVCMVVQECPPRLRWRPSAPDHVFGDRRLGDLEPELEQFTMDARGAPQWVLLAHPLDEFAQLTANSGPPWPSARFPAPIRPKPGAMPAQDRVRLNDAGQTEQAWPEPSHPYHQRPVTPTKS